jgi:glycosyltransferase involved in cell wall biosynthesis
VANAALEQARIFCELGHEVEVFTSGDGSATPGIDGLPIWRFQVSGKSEFFSRACGDLGGLEAYFRQSSWDAVILNCWHVWTTHIAIRFFRSYDRPEKLVVVSHGFAGNIILSPRNLFSYIKNRPFAWYTLPRFLKQIDVLVNLWDRVDDDRFYDVKIAKELTVKTCCIPNIFTENSQTGSSEPEFDSTDKLSGTIFLCVGNYSELKNERFVLDAFYMANISNCTLVFVGPDFNDYKKSLETKSNGLEQGKKVVFLEKLSRHQIESLYQLSSLVLCGSRTECQPLAIVDAIGHGVPFISTPVGCVPDLKGGFVVSSPQAMAEKIEMLTGDESLRHGLKRDLRDQALSFSRENVKKKYAALLDSLVS